MFVRAIQALFKLLANWRMNSKSEEEMNYSPKFARNGPNSILKNGKILVVIKWQN